MLCESIAYFARTRPGKLACVDLAQGRRLTYAQLERRSARMGVALERLLGAGKVRDARVAVLARNSSDVICLHLACRRVGAVFVPLNWRLSGAELGALVRLAAPSLLVLDEEFAPLAAQLHESAPFARVMETGSGRSLEQLLARVPEDANCPRSVDTDATVTLLFTSGTTGKPKAVIVTGRNAHATTRNYGLSVNVNASTVFLCDMPLFHVVGLFAVANTVLNTGGTLLLSAQFSAPDTQARIADEALGVTHYFCVPQMARMLRECASFDPAPYRRLVALQTGGAPHAAEAVRQWLDDGVRCVDGFGMSEAGTVLGMPPDDLELLRRKAGSAGLPAVSMEVRLVDANGRDVSPGETGELWLRGPSVTSGYWGDTQATLAAFQDGWLKTGDAARRDADGFYTLVDRWKDMYISGGENVYPAEVEAVLMEVAGVAEAAVLGIRNERWGEVGAAYVVLAKDATFSPEAMLEHCRRRLAGYKLPKELHVVDTLPRTASGKVRKDVLRAQRGA